MGMNRTRTPCCFDGREVESAQRRARFENLERYVIESANAGLPPALRIELLSQLGWKFHKHLSSVEDRRILSLRSREHECCSRLLVRDGNFGSGLHS